MRHRWRARAVTLFLALSVLFASVGASAVAATSTSSTDDLLAVKLFDKCRGLLPSKKIEYIKSETKKIVGDSVDECLNKPLGEKLPCLHDKLKGEADRIAGVLYFLYYWYSTANGESGESVVGDIGKIEAIRADPMILLEDKDLLPELVTRVATEVEKLQKAGRTAKCGKDSSLLAQLDCLKAQVLPNASARQTLLIFGILQIYLMKEADQQQVGEQVSKLQATLKRASADPKLLADKNFREQMKTQVAEIKTRSGANLDFWAVQSREALRSLRGIVSDAKDLKLSAGPLDLGPDWDRTFGPQWDKSFGPGGDMEQWAKEMEQTNRELQEATHVLEKATGELEQASGELEQANHELEQANRGIGQVKLSMDAAMEKIDRDMAGLRKDVEAMYEIQNRKHPEVWDGIFKDLDLKSVGEYVRDGHMSPEENKLFQAIVSGSLDLTPIAGDAKGIMEAIAGKDAVTGQRLSGSERLIGSVILFRWLKVGKKVITAEELAKATKAEKATGKIDGWMSRAAYDKVPDSLRKHESFTNKGVGYRWNDGKGNGIRIDKGNPNNSQPYQQVDHVVINSGGNVLGRDGKPLAGSIKQNAYEAHIPVTEWLKWKEWNRP